MARYGLVFAPLLLLLCSCPVPGFDRYLFVELSDAESGALLADWTIRGIPDRANEHPFRQDYHAAPPTDGLGRTTIWVTFVGSILDEVTLGAETDGTESEFVLENRRGAVAETNGLRIRMLNPDAPAPPLEYSVRNTDDGIEVQLGYHIASAELCSRMTGNQVLDVRPDGPTQILLDLSQPCQLYSPSGDEGGPVPCEPYECSVRIRRSDRPEYVLVVIRPTYDDFETLSFCTNEELDRIIACD